MKNRIFLRTLALAAISTVTMLLFPAAVKAETTEETTDYPVYIETTEEETKGETEISKPDEPEVEQGWKEIDGRWYFIDESGKAKTGWLPLGNTWYYLLTEEEAPESPGAMVTGWYTIGNDRYHFQKDGVMETGWTKQDGSWYYLQTNGALGTGWLSYQNRWYYFDAVQDGKMADDEWKLIQGRWYHFYAGGVMETGWTRQNGSWYHLNQSGAMETGWVSLDGIWYYFDSARGGQMSASEWKQINGSWYHFYGGGGMETGWTKLNGNWYHLSNSGAMETGWMAQNGDWYYLYPAGNSAGAPEGAMATGTTIDGYVISPDGIQNDAYQGAYNVLNQVGWSLWSAYNWSANLPYVNYSNDSSPGSKNFAIHGFQTKTGDCYVMAGTFYYMAKLLGYDAHQIAGYVPLRGGKMGVHSWVEIDMNGSTYVFDPDFTNETGRNGYQISYGMSGTWRYSDYYRMN